MTDHPIIFSGPMVQALLDGRKSMTRRLAYRDAKPAAKWSFRKDDKWVAKSSWQKVRAGDRLWARESITSDEGLCVYRADHPSLAGKWTPSIHMPRHCSRLTLIVTATKIERLHEISYHDALAEGMPNFGAMPPRGNMGPVDGETMDDCARRLRWPQRWFADLWRNLHGAESWSANPEVVCLSFKAHKSNIDAMPKDKAA